MRSGGQFLKRDRHPRGALRAIAESQPACLAVVPGRILGNNYASGKIECPWRLTWVLSANEGAN